MGRFQYVYFLIIFTVSGSLHAMQTPYSASEEECVSRSSTLPKTTLRVQAPPDEGTGADEDEVPWGIRANSSCMNCCLRGSTTFYFVVRGVSNFFSLVFYSIGGGLIAIPSMLTSDSSMLKICNVASLCAMAGGVALERLATGATRAIERNERHFAEAQAWLLQREGRASGSTLIAPLPARHTESSASIMAPNQAEPPQSPASSTSSSSSPG